jgi:putative copper export protein
VAAGDALLVLIRWLHGLAAVAWIGSIMYELLVIPGNLADQLPSSAIDRMRAARTEIAQASLFTFLATGAVLTFDRLSQTGADTAYVGTLALKIALSIAMFQVAFRARDAVGNPRVQALRGLAGLGGVILLLAALLKTLFERAILR